MSTRNRQPVTLLKRGLLLWAAWLRSSGHGENGPGGAFRIGAELLDKRPRVVFVLPAIQPGVAVVRQAHARHVRQGGAALEQNAGQQLEVVAVGAIVRFA